MVVNVLCSPPVGESLCSLFHGAIPHRGHRILVDRQFVTPTTVARIYFGSYEQAEISLVACFLPPNYDVIELGASLGVNSCNIASRLDSGRRLICVEADPRLAELATQTITLNGYAEKATVVNAAVDYSGAPRVLLHRGDDSLSANIVGCDEVLDDTVEVDAITLHEILDDRQIDDYSLVTDIEGAELALLLNEEAALERCRAIIIEIEAWDYCGETYSQNRIRNLILALGFVEAYTYGRCVAFLRDHS